MNPEKTKDDPFVTYREMEGGPRFVALEDYTSLKKFCDNGLDRAKDVIFSYSHVIKDLAQALESYDFGPGTIGHDILKKHEKIIAEVVVENNSRF